MKRRFGSGDYQYECVEGWPKQEIKGVAADVACDSRGRVYVGVRSPYPDGSIGGIFAGEGTVVVLDRDGGYLEDWGNVCSSPHGVWINAQDEIFLADTGLHTVTKHAPSGEVLLQIGTKGAPSAPGQPFNMPTHAKQAPNGDIFVSDGYGQNRVHRFSPEGEHLLSWGAGESIFLPGRFPDRFPGQAPGPRRCGPGEFNVPHDVMVDRHSRVYVMDRENHRWQVFTMLGEFVSMCTGLNPPNDVAVDSDDVMHIVSGRGVELRKADGTPLGQWGERGSEPGQFTGGAHGVWMDPEGSLYIAEVGVNNRLQKFARV